MVICNYIYHIINGDISAILISLLCSFSCCHLYQASRQLCEDSEPRGHQQASKPRHDTRGAFDADHHHDQCLNRHLPFPVEIMQSNIVAAHTCILLPFQRDCDSFVRISISDQDFPNISLFDLKLFALKK